jgi:hypothetical protein
MSFEILDSVIMTLKMMNLSLIIDLEYFQFGPLILEFTFLSLNFKKLLFGPYVVLDRIEDGLWVKFQYGYVFTVWSSFDKIMFWSLFWIIVVLVPKPRRLNLGFFFYALESFICVVLNCFRAYFIYLLQVWFF